MKISGDLKTWLAGFGYDADTFFNKPCVYTLLSDHGPVKVGISRDVFRRVESINRGSFVKAAIWSLHPTPLARQVEQLAHERMSEHRLDGEWFDVPIQFADRTVRDCLDHLEKGLNLTDAAPLDFSRAWEFTGELIDGDWGKIGKYWSYADGIAPVRSWALKRDEHIARFYELQAGGRV